MLSAVTIVAYFVTSYFNKRTVAMPSRKRVCLLCILDMNVFTRIKQQDDPHHYKESHYWMVILIHFNSSQQTKTAVVLINNVSTNSEKTSTYFCICPGIELQGLGALCIWPSARYTRLCRSSHRIHTQAPSK